VEIDFNDVIVKLLLCYLPVSIAMVLALMTLMVVICFLKYHFAIGEVLIEHPILIWDALDVHFMVLHQLFILN
jgi:hypothetical protein